MLTKATTEKEKKCVALVLIILSKKIQQSNATFLSLCGEERKKLAFA